jgi:hypothetical protein
MSGSNLANTNIPNNPKKNWDSVWRGQIWDNMRFQPLY